MTASNPEPNTSSVPEPRQKPITEPIYTYAVSWKWLIIGLISVFGLGGIAGTTYYIRSSNMASKIIDVVQRMLEESEKDREQIEQTKDLSKKMELMGRSLKLRSDAANLLNNYRQANPDSTGSIILEKLYEILEGLYKDYGESSTPRGLERGEQLTKLAVELARTVPEVDSIKYHTRLLELAWDRRSFPQIIERGLELLSASQAIGTPKNYEAMRYIAMALFDHLPTQTYVPTDYKLPLTLFPETMDELLGNLNSMRPEDIEIAKRYAEFIVSVDKENFAACTSSQLRDNSKPADRIALAKNRIDDMVQRNRDNPAAYLARFHFVSQFARPSEELDQANPDLLMVLELEPSHPEGLILASLDALRQSDIAARTGETTRASEWQHKAEEYLRRTTRDNPNDPFGYQYLGDYLLFVKKDSEGAIDIWNQGLKNSNHRGDEELIGRLVMALLEKRRVDDVREKLEHLSQTIAEMRFSRSAADVRRTNNMLILLTAQLYYTEAKIAASKIEAAQRENRRDEVQRLYRIVQQKQGDAMQKFDSLLRDFGRTRDDYVFEKKSVYVLLLPQSLMQVGELKMEWSMWDSAASYFERASYFEVVRQQALLAKSAAYQRWGHLDRAAQALKDAYDRAPNDLSIRYAYTMVLFRSQVGSNNVRAETLDVLQKELEALGNHRSELPQPWVLDIRLIHLGIARANLSNSADQILEAMTDATRKFRVLERGTFPPDADGNVRNYIDDPAFVIEMVGNYSSLAARSDFDRLLPKLREFPEGEAAYFEARINDCLRRSDKDGAVAVIDEATESTQLSASAKERFAALLPALKGENVDNARSLDKAYERLKTTFDQSPETLNPQAFFVLANMSLDRGEIEHAIQIRERLEKIEGPEGVWWRYVEVRIMLSDKDPDYARIREIQETIVKYRADWDMGYILRATIEEQYLAANPGNTDVRDLLIGVYRSATQFGNRQSEVWQRLAGLLENAGRTEEAKDVIRQAALRGVILESRTGQLPQPYERMYSQVLKALEGADAIEADAIARQCITLAERKGEKPDLIFTLHLVLGKAFLDAPMYDSAIRHLSVTAERGGTYVYPLAVCVAKSGDIDGGFSLLIDEIDRVPSAMQTLLPAVLVLLTQVQPSEAVFERIDRLMNRIERGERLTLKGVALDSESGSVIPVGTKWVQTRKIQSLVIRFPERTEPLDPSMIQLIAPEEGSREEAPAEQPAQQQ